MKCFLLCGIPGTGKTSIGNFLKDEMNYVHLDLEEELKFTNDWQVITQKVQDLNAEHNLVITWGFVPDEASMNYVSDLIENFSARMVWFDGDREIAKKVWLLREENNIKNNISNESNFDEQIKRINEAKVIEKYDPFIIDPFNTQGGFRDSEEIVQKIISHQFNHL